MPALPFSRRLIVASFLLLLGSSGTFSGIVRGQAPPATPETLPSFQESCFQSFETKRTLPQESELREWFDVIAGQPQGIFETRTRLGLCAGIEGIVRLKKPWLEGYAWRVALDDYHRLQIHLFRGQAGLTLVYHEDDLFRWSVYQTTRTERAVTPTSWVLVGTDNHRNRRTNPKGHDQYELRCVGGELLLTRGDVELIRAPLGGLPEEVYLQGKAVFHGLEMTRTANPPTQEVQANAGTAVRPDRVPWIQQLDADVQVELATEGPLRMTSPGRTKKRSWAATPLPRDALTEVRIEVADVRPGSGIYLGNGKDGPRYVLRYVTDRRSKQMCVVVRADDDQDEHEFRGLHETSLPAVPTAHWVRLVFGAGQIRWWISPDGSHWSEPTEPIRGVAPDVSHVGVHVVNRREPTGITLRQIVISPLPQLARLVDPSLLPGTSVSLASAPTLGLWLASAVEQAPSGADLPAWRRTCAWRTLAAGCSRPLGNELVALLLRDPATLALPLSEQLAILSEAALVMDLWDDPAALQKWHQRHAELGMAVWREQGIGPYSAVRHAWMTAPVATRHALELPWDELLPTELVQRIQAGDWESWRRTSREWRFFQLAAKVPLIDWADSQALRRIPMSANEPLPITKQKDEWRELLVEDLSKDVYNALAQLRVELSTAGREDAARAISAFGLDLPPGVAPHGRDDRLLVSLPTAVQETLRDDPALRTVVAEKYGDIASLRLKQALDQRDPEAVAMLAWQFAGTAAAGEAHTWLGDRALSLGDFPRAVEEYQQSVLGSDPLVAAQQAPRLRLAAALAKRDLGVPLAGPATFGEKVASPEEFEQWLREIKERQAVGEPPLLRDAVVNVRGPELPPPALYQAHRRAKLDGPVGNDPNREFVRDTARRQIDWVDRQLAWSLSANVLYVCNRFQVAAYDLQGSKQRLWQSPQIAGQMQFAQESPFIPSRPLVVGNRLWARLLYGSGGTLVCLDRANGQLVWSVTPGLNEEWVSDPLSSRGGLRCLKLVRTEQQDGLLRLVTLDPRTGFVVQEQDVVRLRDHWRRRRCCEWTAVNDELVIVCGGVVVRLDASGQVLWIRRPWNLPPDEDPHWLTQSYQPPLVLDDLVFAGSPGCRLLEAIDWRHGTVRWSRQVMDLERIVGVAGPLLVLQTTKGLLACRLADGEVAWRTDLEQLTTGVAVGPNFVVALQRYPIDAPKTRYRPRLLWFDLVKGVPRASTPLADLEEVDPRVGPLIVDQNRFWTFWGKGQNDPQRDLVELLPSGIAEPVPVIDSTAWNAPLDPKVRDAAGRLLPAWSLFHAEGGDRSGLLAEMHGEKELLGLRAKTNLPIIWGRAITLPAQGKPLLRWRFGNEPAQPWQLEVRFGAEVIWSQEIKPDTHPQPWKSWEIDLSALAGRSGWLTVHARLPKGGDAPTYWKSLELVF